MKTTYTYNLFNISGYSRHRFNVGSQSRLWFNVGFYAVVHKQFAPVFLPGSGAGFSISSFRCHHTKKFNLHLNKLYAAKGRKRTLRPFEEVPVKVCSDLRSKETIKNFFKEFYNKGGIYKFVVKGKPNLYYIGATNNLYRRFKQHTSPNNLDWDNFHIFAQFVGWDKFEYAILEVTNEIKVLRKQENFYLKKYAPLLNATFSSSIKIFEKENTYKIDKDNASNLKDNKFETENINTSEDNHKK